MPARHTPAAFIGQYTPLHITAAGTLVPVGLCVNTTAPTTISAGAQTVTPVSMAGIIPGLRLNFANGTGAAEDVQVTAITSTTFTATFANGHSGAYTITSKRGSFLGGVTINKAGTSDSITLYNGRPNTLPVAGAAIAIITSPVAGKTYLFNAALDNGLFYTVAGSPVGDYTLAFTDTSLGL